MDTDGDGRVDKEEFADFFDRTHPGMRIAKTKLHYTFGREDLDKDGYITFDEFSGHRLVKYTAAQAKWFNTTRFDEACRVGNCDACPWVPLHELNQDALTGREKACVSFCKEHRAEKKCVNPPGPIHLIGGIGQMHVILTTTKGHGFEEAEHAIETLEELLDEFSKNEMDIKEKGGELPKEEFPPYLADLVEPFLYGPKTDWITKDKEFTKKYGDRGHMSRLLGVLSAAEAWANHVSDDKIHTRMHEILNKLNEIFSAGVDRDEYGLNGNMTSDNMAFKDGEVPEYNQHMGDSHQEL
jgi:hypothetical protein